jgi:DNA-binding protein HU-beta
MMNKGALIEEISKVLDNRRQAQAALNSLLESIEQALMRGEAVTLSGFGTFKVSERKARTGRNPRTGEAIAIKAKRSPRFVPGKALKTAVN